MVDNTLLHARPDGGLGALTIGGVSQCLFVQCPLMLCPFRDGERIFGRGVIALSHRVYLPGFLRGFLRRVYLLGFLPGEYANGIFQCVGCVCRDVYGTRDRLCRALRRAGRSGVCSPAAWHLRGCIF